MKSYSCLTRNGFSAKKLTTVHDLMVQPHVPGEIPGEMSSKVWPKLAKHCQNLFGDFLISFHKVMWRSVWGMIGLYWSFYCTISWPDLMIVTAKKIEISHYLNVMKL